MIETKKCSVCNITKSIDEFHADKRNKDGKRELCKECKKEKSKEYYQKHKDRMNKQGKKYKKEHREEAAIQNKIWYENIGREKGGHISMYENRNSAQYLGIVIAERLCRHLFKDVEVMPYGNPGFDFICNKGMKIDVKSACVTFTEKYPRWIFKIDYNTIPDYFICVAFDNRTDLNPLHLWMIPGKEINENSGRSISPSTIYKWDKWKQDITNAQICCAEMKNNK